MGVVDKLLASNEPSVQYRVRSRVLEEAEDSLGELRERIKESARVRTLLVTAMRAGESSGSIRPTRSGRALTGYSRLWRISDILRVV